MLRITAIITSDFKSENNFKNCYSLKISDLRGTIYDCNMVPLTNNQEKIIAAISPTEKGITAIRSVLKGEELEKILNILNCGDPVVCEIPKEIKNDGIVTTKIYVTSSNFTPAVHLLGYVNTDNIGVSGLEKAYNDILYSDHDVMVFFESNGKL